MGPAHAVVIAPTDANIQYMGRWNFSDPALPTIGWQGGAITVNFSGTEIKATLDADDTSNHWETFRVVVDDDYSTTYTFLAGPTPTQHTLASGLPDGVHKVVLMKETYAWYDSVFHGLEVTGAGLVAPPALSGLRFECFGDSNAAGENIASESNSSGTGQYFAFPFIAARAFGAEIHNASTSGETISGSHGRFDRYGWWPEDPPWDFGLYTPDVVIVELGANDVGSLTESEMMADHNAYLDELRATYPDAHITLMNGAGWDLDEPANYTASLVAARSDPHMSALVHPWVFGQWHGSEDEHAGMARYLVEHLEGVLSITAPNPIDVMDGFGVGGDVANGGFEEVAPFGGYAWRFSSDPSVDRVHDPSGAKEGEHYLELSSNDESFQTNPAASGDTITLTAWMRGKKNGAEVDMTIDFRDQSMGGLDVAPVVAHTETKPLTTSWAEYTVVATALTTGNPTFGTRTTFEAGPGDTVYIDDVQMVTVPEPAQTWALAAGMTLLWQLQRRRGKFAAGFAQWMVKRKLAPVGSQNRSAP
jgi:hypothetical protein